MMKKKHVRLQVTTGPWAKIYRFGSNNKLIDWNVYIAEQWWYDYNGTEKYIKTAEKKQQEPYLKNYT